MPKNYGAPFVRITAHGRIYTTETWQTGLNVISSGALPEPTQAQADAALAAWTTLYGQTIISGFTQLVGVKVARIGADGLYTSPRPVEASKTAPGQNGGGSGQQAPQVALAVTLEGPNPRGAAGRGRIYLPVPSFSIDGTGRITQADALKAANAVAGLINSINTAFDGLVGIVGPATDTGRGPARQPVVGVRVGRVYDTIRSRRTSFPEEPVFATVGVSETDPGAGSGVGGFDGGGGDF